MEFITAAAQILCRPVISQIYLVGPLPQVFFAPIHHINATSDKNYKLSCGLLEHNTSVKEVQVDNAGQRNLKLIYETVP